MQVKSGQDIKITACMMVKNEEEMLPRCLTSIKDLVDEIVVVDTGSEDKTIEIAESFGARIYHHPWENNFSTHRNQSISYATGDWIFIIDADEELKIPQGSSFEKFRGWLANMPETSNAAAIQLHDRQNDATVMKMNTARFFRKGCIHYTGEVHNQPQVKGKGQGYFCPLLYLFHYGYGLSSEKMNKKEERTKSLLLEQLKKDPKSYSSYFYLSQLSATRGRSQECVDYGEEYLKHKGELAENFNKSVYYTVICHYRKLGNRIKAEQWLDMALAELPNDLDIFFALIEFGLWTMDVDKVIVGGHKYLKLYNEIQMNPASRQNRFMYSNTPEALAWVVSKLVITQLSDGFNVFEILKEVFPKIKPALAKGLLDETNESLKKYGLQMSMNTPENKIIEPSTRKRPVSFPNEKLMKHLEA